MSVYCIKAAVVHVAIQVGSWRIRSFPVRVGHHFWVLVEKLDGKEIMIDSIHGLSTKFSLDHNGNKVVQIPRCLGTYGSCLQLYSIPHPSRADKGRKLYPRLHWIEPEEIHTVYDASDSETRWRMMKSCIERLNRIEVPTRFVELECPLGCLIVKTAILPTQQ